MAIIIESEAYICICLVEIRADNDSSLQFLSDSHVFGRSEHEVHSARFEKDRQDVDIFDVVSGHFFVVDQFVAPVTGPSYKELFKVFKNLSI